MNEILVYLFNNYLKDRNVANIDPDVLYADLHIRGFTKEEIKKALLWINSLIAIQNKPKRSKGKKNIRIFSTAECDHINLLYRELLIELENSGILNAYSRELVVSQLLQLDKKEITLFAFNRMVVVAQHLYTEYVDNK